MMRFVPLSCLVCFILCHVCCLLMLCCVMWCCVLLWCICCVVMCCVAWSSSILRCCLVRCIVFCFVIYSFCSVSWWLFLCPVFLCCLAPRLGCSIGVTFVLYFFMSSVACPALVRSFLAVWHVVLLTLYVYNSFILRHVVPRLELYLLLLLGP
jgi:hypothetical protein